MLTVRVKVALIFNILIIFFMLICNFSRYCGHSMGVIPGLVSIPVVKSFCVLFVYYGFLWEFHFAASLLYIQILLNAYYFHTIMSIAVIAWGLYLVSFRSQ